MTQEERLTAYEAMQREVEARCARTREELDGLKAAGKIKTVRYRELLARRLTEQEWLDLYTRYGLRDQEKSV